MRIVSQFSCGAASAVATKLMIQQYPDLEIVNAFVRAEHPDNRRFLRDCEKWFGKSVRVLRNRKYRASTFRVWIAKRFIKGPHGAPCSMELKRSLLAEDSRPDDVWILGFTAGEQDRLDLFIDANNGRKVIAPLIDRGITKEDCLSIIDRAGILLPKMHWLGFQNSNCIGCPKGGQNYWQHIRKHFPRRFAMIRKIQDAIGAGAHFLQFRSGPRKGERMSLADLPKGEGNMRDEPDFNCGILCELITIDITSYKSNSATAEEINRSMAEGPGW